MKATVFFKAMAFATMTMISLMNSTAKAQDDNFITNEEVKDELVVAKTIFKQEGNYLSKQFRYEFTYDEQKRLTSKQAEKWDSTKQKWMPYYKITYTYSLDKIVMDYARWNEKHRAYDKDAQRSSYELNETNMPVAQKTYKRTGTKKDLTWVDFNKKDHTAHERA